MYREETLSIKIGLLGSGVLNGLDNAGLLPVFATAKLASLRWRIFITKKQSKQVNLFPYTLIIKHLTKLETYLQYLFLRELAHFY